MAINLLETLTETLGSQIAKQASEYLGEPENTTKSALGISSAGAAGQLVETGFNAGWRGQPAKDARWLQYRFGSSREHRGSVLGQDQNGFPGFAGYLFGGQPFRRQGGFDRQHDRIADRTEVILLLQPPVSDSPAHSELPEEAGERQKSGLTGLARVLGEQTGFLKGKINPQLAGALGLGSFFNDGAAQSSSRPAYTPLPEEKERSLFSKLLPWLIGLAALLAGLALFRGSDKLKLGEETAPPSTAVAPAPKVAVPPVARPAPAVAVLPAKIYFDVGSQVIDGPSGVALAQTAVAVKNQGLPSISRLYRQDRRCRHQ